MELLRSSNYKYMPWKNGGGETVEIAVFPPDASVETFDWRISMAAVAGDGPFSIFPGIDRTLSILNGNGMSLRMDGQEPVLMTLSSPPLAFPADVPVEATLVDGPISDLNVMTRRGRYRHSVERLSGRFSVSKQSENETVFILAKGEIYAVSDHQSLALTALDAVSINGTVAIQPDHIVCYIIRLTPQD
ncbi:HutD family protein [Rhizobium skierniewicense]|uniref:HutD/Ves family protein n=1 Tax=Rhizobium skierniewicense TaxID=984260 RepID=UPI00157445D7|nr:HutD family protein [Rhizobium skierniewicense]NTF30648.1 HutD family protein [Rhizobium skierniewicense]